MSTPEDCPYCEPELPCVTHMSTPELLDEIATFEPEVENHDAWRELSRRIRVIHADEYAWPHLKFTEAAGEDPPNGASER